MIEIDQELKGKLEKKGITTFIPALHYLIKAGYDDLPAFTNCVYHFTMENMFDGFCRARYEPNEGRGLFIYDADPIDYDFVDDFIKYCIDNRLEIDEFVATKYEFAFGDTRVSNYLYHLTQNHFGEVGRANKHSKFVDDLPF